MNAKRYAELKEMVIGMNNIEIINLTEILKEETEHRRIDIGNREI